MFFYVCILGHLGKVARALQIILEVIFYIGFLILTSFIFSLKRLTTTDGGEHCALFDGNKTLQFPWPYGILIVSYFLPILLFFFQ